LGSIRISEDKEYKQYINDSLKEEIFLSKRFHYPKKAILKLNEIQLDAKKEYERALKKGDFLLRKTLCYCGNTNDIILANVDRYGLWVRTVLCQTCGLVRTDPQLTPSSLELFYKNIYRRLYSGSPIPIEQFFTNQMIKGEKIKKLIFEHTPLKKGRIFELGSGAGGILKPFLDAGYEVTGVDFDKKYVEFGKKRGINLLIGGIELLQKEKGKADIIILSHVLEHLPNLDEILEQLKMCLKPQGILYIELPGIFSIPNNYKNNFLIYLQNAHIYHFTLTSLSYILNKNQFELMWGNDIIEAIYHVVDKSIDVKIEKELANNIKIFLKKTDSLAGRIKSRFIIIKNYLLKKIVRILEILHLKDIIKKLR
jgi:2-polyprenyl-3-methyl-5-hydroxy-6-metoxy-1,4-benzoquinol methylase